LDGLSLSKPDSALGIPINSGSLPSRFKPGITVVLADRIKAIAAAGPRETLRLLRSTESARSSVLFLSLLEAVARFAGAPGLGLTATAGFAVFVLGGDCATGPPSLRLIKSHGPGSRAEKLWRCVSRKVCAVRFVEGLQWYNNIHAKVP
jgi:hypothetical protein